ncbi:MAG TPA: TonB family protein [Polyangiaceae bacterium]|nr:TonB family protein [Polyangiaceae bacterium]
MLHRSSLSPFRRGHLALASLAALLVASATATAEPAPPEARPVTPPVVSSHVDAVYPSSALAGGKHGDVTLAVTVDADGHVSAVTVLQSGGADLDEAAVVAVRQWTFEPATRGDKPVASRIRIPFHFAPPAPPPELVEPKPMEEPTLPPQSASPPSQVSSPAPSDPRAPAEVFVGGRRQAPSRGASDFRISRATLNAAPHGSAADLLSTAPGVFVAHPEGEAVAQRIYLRGFDSEHGQDVEFKVAGIPMNQPSHIHGQGYADLNLVIPEVVRSLRVVEGVYDPRQGDFAVAGSVEYDLGVEERRSRIKASAGSFGTRRLLGLWAPKDQSEETFGAATFRETDGFGDGTRGGISGSALGQYRLRLPGNIAGLLHLGAYAGRANLAGVVRRDDLEARRIGFYDAYPDASARAQSAGTSRVQVGLSFEWQGEGDARVAAGVFTYLATFRSRLNFTGYMERSRFNPDWVGRGDLVEQSNDDLGLGGSFAYSARRVEVAPWLDAQVHLGSDLRTHRIAQAQNLLQAPQNETWDERDDATVRQTDLGFYGDLALTFSSRARLRGGARSDLLFFDVDDELGNFVPAFSQRSHIVGFRRTAAGIAFGPRASFEIDPLSWLRLSASYGEGYRSPQARQLEEGERAPFAKVRSYEVGATLRAGRAISITGIGYQTNLSYDLAFDPAASRLERIGPTTRRGLVGYFVAHPAPWLDASISATYVRAILDSPPIPTPEDPSPPYVKGQSLPYVPPVVLRSDIGFQSALGRLWNKPIEWKAGYGTTLLSSRPLPYGQSSPPVFLLDATLGVRRDWLELSVDATNLLGARFADTEYSFVSSWLTTPVPSRVPARHFTAGPPRAIFANLTVYL